MFASRARWEGNQEDGDITAVVISIKWQMESSSHSLTSFYSGPPLLIGSATCLSPLHSANLWACTFDHHPLFLEVLSPHIQLVNTYWFSITRKNLQVISTMYVTNNAASHNPNLHLIFAYLKILRKQQTKLIEIKQVCNKLDQSWFLKLWTQNWNQKGCMYYVRQILTRMKEEINSNTIIVGDLIPHSQLWIDQLNRKLTRKHKL